MEANVATADPLSRAPSPNFAPPGASLLDLTRDGPLTAIENNARFKQTRWGRFQADALERDFVDAAAVSLLPLYLLVGLIGLVLSGTASHSAGSSVWALFLVGEAAKMCRSEHSGVISSSSPWLLQWSFLVCLGTGFAELLFEDAHSGVDLTMALATTFTVFSTALLVPAWQVACVFISACFAALATCLWRSGSSNSSIVALCLFANWLVVCVLAHHISSLSRRRFLLVRTIQEQEALHLERRREEDASLRQTMLTQERAAAGQLFALAQNLATPVSAHALLGSQTRMLLPQQANRKQQ
jgi:hypothetical protein